MAAKLPAIVLYLWLMLVVFQVGNQSIPAAPAEDRLNKLWRPNPAGRVSREQAHGLAGPGVLLLLAGGLALGVFPEAVLFAAATCVYTGGGGSEVLGPRQAANGMLLASGGQAALEVAAWAAAHFGLAATTIQVMDFRDQAGDAAIGRQTLPLVIGDAAARWATCVSLLFWASLCPWLCDSGLPGYTLSAATAGIAVFKLVAYRTVSADRQTYRLCSVWLAVVYAMPWLSLLPSS